MSFIEHETSLHVRQRKELVEALVGWEKTNQYDIHSPDGSLVGTAQENKNGWFLRNLLGSARPFTITINDAGSGAILRLIRPFRWFFSALSITDAEGRILGTIKQEFAWFTRVFSVFDSSDHQILKIRGPFFKPWTFYVYHNEVEVAVITKKWSGLAKEAFTKADNFGVLFHANCREEHRSLICGAVFLIDYCFFERSS